MRNTSELKIFAKKMLRKFADKTGMQEASKKWGARSKKGHMTTPINGQKSKRFESIPNQVHTVFVWELKIINLRVYLKSC